MSARNKETRIRLSDVLEILPISKATWYRGIQDGRYPEGTPITGKRAVGWKLSEIEKIARNGVKAGGAK